VVNGLAQVYADRQILMDRRIRMLPKMRDHRHRRPLDHVFR
jgi:hypothetical protein